MMGVKGGWRGGDLGGMRWSGWGFLLWGINDEGEVRG